ncbi:MAG: hypothetical protein RLZZ628_1984 [Bacteroidota bacterium]|jgi:hypothetical protein
MKSLFLRRIDRLLQSSIPSVLEKSPRLFQAHQDRHMGFRKKSKDTTFFLIKKKRFTHERCKSFKSRRRTL